MGTLVELQTKHEEWTPPAEQPLDERVWQAWLAKGRARDRRRSAAFIKGVKWISLAALLAAAGQWNHPGLYDVVVRFVVATGAMVMMFHAFRSWHYIVGAAFGALVVLYNPLLPVFGFSGEWRSAAVVASAVPFIVSLAWREPRMEKSV